MEDHQQQVLRIVDHKDEKKPGYKKTKLGWIPEDWDIDRIDKLAKTTAGGTPNTKNKDYWGGEIPWMSSGELNHKIVHDVEGRITELGLKESSAKLIPAKSVLVGLAGQGKTRGTAAINEIKLTTNQSVAAIIPNAEKIHYKYLYYNIDRRYDELRQLSTGAGGRGGLNLKIINGFKIPYPEIPEQEQISELINKWDEAIFKMKKLINQKILLKKGLMQQLLTGKKRLPGFSGEWKEYTYRQLLKEVKRDFEWNDNEKYDLISVRRRSGGLFHRDSLFGHQIKTKNLRTAKAGDFLISKMQIVHGASGLTTEEFDSMKISGSYIALVSRDKDTLDINFLNWYSKLPEFYHQCYISSYGVHIEKMTFDFKLFLKEKIRIPELDEQKAIINVLQASQKEIELLKNKKEMLQTQKKGLMQQLLTGKKRLTE